MREDLLHFIWKYKKLPLKHLSTTLDEMVVILDVGTHNLLEGPDFFNAKITINGQLWAGNVEIHIKSSDWYAHNHEQDDNYNNVILHVVWEDDGNVFRSDNSVVPTLQLKGYISEKLLQAYTTLFEKKSKTFINCENNLGQINSFILQNWLERLYFERLENKSSFVSSLLVKSRNDWEQALFSVLLKCFGSKINGSAFLSMSNAVDFSVVRKTRSNLVQLEGLFLGISHLLEDDNITDRYHIQLKIEYLFVKKKFELCDDGVEKPAFFKLRPSNFPTIRLSQLANLYHRYQHLFIEVLNAVTLAEMYDLFDVTASGYWHDRFTFGKSSGYKPKKLSKQFIDLLVLNAILPMKCAYAKHVGKDINEEIIGIVSEMKLERNGILDHFKSLGIANVSARDGQALLQLYNEYCTKNKCLHCAVGNVLLGS